MPWIWPALGDTISTVAPALRIAFAGSVSSDCSKPSITTTAMRLPESSLATVHDERLWII